MVMVISPSWHNHTNPIKHEISPSWHNHTNPIKHGISPSWHKHSNPIKHEISPSWYKHTNPIKHEMSPSWHKHSNPIKHEISPSWHNHTNPIKHYHHTFGWKPDDGRNRPKHVITIIFIKHLFRLSKEKPSWCHLFYYIFNTHSMLNMFRPLIRPSSGVCD